MNKKGFTLVELIAIIVILGVVLVIAIPTVSNIVENSRIESFNKSEVTMIEAAKGYMLLNTKYIPANIGDTTEITVEEMQANKTLGVIVNPWNESEKCSGYVLTTKVADKEYTYHPYLNCDNNIGSSAEDKLIVRYTFDDFQEPTQNLVLNGDFSDGISNWACSTANTQYMNNYCTVKYENGEPYLNVHWERKSGSGDTWPSVKSQGTFYDIAGVPYTLSLKIRINSMSGTAGEIRHSALDNDYWTSGRKTWGFGKRELGVWHDVSLTRTFDENYTNSAGVVHPLSGRVEFYSGNFEVAGEYVDFDIKEIQIEPKPYATNFIQGSREGNIIDYSTNNNHLNLQLSNTPKWSSDTVQGEGAYEFDGINDSIKLPKEIGMDLHESNFTLSAIVKSNGMADNMTMSGVVSINYGLTMYLTSNGNLAGRMDNGTSIVATETTGLNLYDNKYHLITMTYDGTHVKLYVDGVKKQEAAREWNNRYHTSDVGGIGFETNNPPVYRYKGIIDDVRIYKRALTDNEIKRMFDSISY